MDVIVCLGVVSHRGLLQSSSQLTVQYDMNVRAAGATDVSAVSAQLQQQLTAAHSAPSGGGQTPFEGALATSSAALGIKTNATVNSAATLGHVGSLSVVVTKVSTAHPTSPPVQSPAPFALQSEAEEKATDGGTPMMVLLIAVLGLVIVVGLPAGYGILLLCKRR